MAAVDVPILCALARRCDVARVSRRGAAQHGHRSCSRCAWRSGTANVAEARRLADAAPRRRKASATSPRRSSISSKARTTQARRSSSRSPTANPLGDAAARARPARAAARPPRRGPADPRSDRGPHGTFAGAGRLLPAGARGGGPPRVPARERRLPARREAAARGHPDRLGRPVPGAAPARRRGRRATRRRSTVDPAWVPAHVGLARALGDEDPQAAKAALEARDEARARPSGRLAARRGARDRRRRLRGGRRGARPRRRASARTPWTRPRCAWRWRTEAGRRRGDRRGHRARPRHRSEVGARLPRRGRAGGARLPVRRRRGVRAARPCARPGRRRRALRSRPVPAAHRRREGRADGARARPGTSTRARRSPRTCSTCSTSSTRSRSCRTATSSSSSPRRKRRCCRPTRCRWPTRRTRRSRSATASRRKGPILVEVFPDARRLRRAHARACRASSARSARASAASSSMDSPTRAAAGRVQLAGDAVARAGARLHAAAVEVPRAAMADRRHLGLRGASPQSGVGPRADARVRAPSSAKGKTFGVKKLPDAFKQPESLSLAYFEASLVVEHLVDAERRRRACGRCSWRTPTARRTPTRSPRRSARASTRSRRRSRRSSSSATARCARRWRSRRARCDAGRSRRRCGARAAAAPGNFVSQLSLGQALFKAGDLDGAARRRSSARPSWRRRRRATAARTRCSRRSPRSDGDDARARRELRALLAYDHANVNAARRLVDARGRRAKAADDEDFALRLVADLDPFDADMHTASSGARLLAKNDNAAALDRVPGGARARPGESGRGAHRCRRGAAQARPQGRGEARRRSRRSRRRRRSRARRTCCWRRSGRN